MPVVYGQKKASIYYYSAVADETKVGSTHIPMLMNHIRRGHTHTQERKQKDMVNVAFLLDKGLWPNTIFSGWVS